MTEYIELAFALEKIASTSKRSEKILIIAGTLKKVQPSEIRFSTMVLAGRVFAESDERTLNVSWASLIGAVKKVINYSDSDFGEFYQGDIGEAISAIFRSGKYSKQQTLFSNPISISSLESDLEQIATYSGKGAKSEREAILSKIFMDASQDEIKSIVALILGDTRTGVSDALVLEGIASAFDIDPDIARRAWSFSGDLGLIASVASNAGEKGVSKIGIALFTPVRPMLATPANSVKEIVSGNSTKFLVEYKYDGARVQIHKRKDTVRIYSRRLNEVTDSMPEIVSEIQEKISADSIILDGEVIAVDEDENPFPFQMVMKRFGRTSDIEETSKTIRLRLILFDILFLDNQMIVDYDLIKRKELLGKSTPDYLNASYHVSNNIQEIEALFLESKEKGHEGIMLKNIESLYIPGKRGKNWFKLKHTLDTLDLVVIAAEWGHGRRKDWLSDYHLGVWDSDAGEFTSVGKTYKGLTDNELEEMTKRLQDISIGSKRGIVTVRPEIVVEIVAAEIQESSSYQSGFALRFARISRIRDDIGPADCTTLEELRLLYEDQFRYKAR